MTPTVRRRPQERLKPAVSPGLIGRVRLGAFV
jgi:hypothetical protein